LVPLNTGPTLAGAASQASSAPYDDSQWNAYNLSAITQESTLYEVLQNYLTFDTGKYTYLLKAQGFDFSASDIQTLNTIVGVVFTFQAHGFDDASHGACSLCYAQLIGDTGSLIGNDVVVNNISISQAGTYSTYTVGASGNLWGATLTPAIVQNANFGVAFAFVADEDNAYIQLKAAKMDVYYTTTAPGDTVFEMSCYHADNKNMLKTNSKCTYLGMAQTDSNNESVFYTDIDAKYYQFVWGQAKSVANGLDCPVAKIIVKGYVY
jgi:hypothetical protein